MDNNEGETKRKWYALDGDSVVKELGSDIDLGLSKETARERLEKYGENKLPERKKQSPILRFLKHFNDILIYVLLVAAIITAFLGHYVDTIVILLVAIINAVIGFFQENKAEKALADIKGMLSHKAFIIRGGKRKEVDATDLTLGDIVLLNPGDKIPADLRLIQTNNLQVEESPLTGESVPSEKNSDTLDEDAMLGDRDNMAFSSTTVSSGTGVGVVVAIGADTEIGKINRMMSDIKPVTTPLLKQTDKFGKTVSIAIIIIAVVIYAFGYFFREYDPLELLLSVIGLAVAAIPEGLPAILSIILAIGVQNMARRKAIIRTLPSVETLGSVSVICSDKTGTLTRNEMTVRTVTTKDNLFKVSGIGYTSDGEITLGEDPVDVYEQPVLKRLVNCFYYCNDAKLGWNNEGVCTVKGDPTEGALLTLYNKSELKDLTAKRIDTVPFDSTYKYMATLMNIEGKKIIFMKGAPDRLVNIAAEEEGESGIKPINRDFWKDKINETAATGQRLIGGLING
ncbi:MAG: HAD-IC family P-type ATPase [Bacteroidales bacterium]|nr:HAD-IC family P-type ATPase [Bacteroidales bacterium]